MELVLNGYHFGLCCTKATYNRMNINSKTYQAMNFIKYNPNCTKKMVQRFIYGEEKGSSYSCFVFKNLLADKLIEKRRKGNKYHYNITLLGEGYIDYINRKHYK